MWAKWFVRYFLLRAGVRALARHMRALTARVGPDAVVSARQVAEIGRALEELLDGRWVACRGE